MKYQAGQLWDYYSQLGEEGSKLLVLFVEKLSDEHVVHVTVVNHSCDCPSHMPFTEDAIDRSVKNLIEDSYPLPDFSSGYEYWRKCFDEGTAGIYKITVLEALDL